MNSIWKNSVEVKYLLRKLNLIYKFICKAICLAVFHFILLWFSWKMRIWFFKLFNSIALSSCCIFHIFIILFSHFYYFLIIFCFVDCFSLLFVYLFNIFIFFWKVSIHIYTLWYIFIFKSYKSMVSWPAKIKNQEKLW